MAVLGPFPKFKATDANGVPLSGALLFTYTAGTTAKKDSYTNAGGGTTNANPVVLDSSGEANVWLSGSYKLVLAPSTDSDPPTSPYWTVDDYDVGAVTTALFETEHNADATHVIGCTSAGDLVYFNGTKMVRLAKGSVGESFVQGASSVPVWMASHQCEVFTSNGTFTVPANVTRVKVTVIGGGGGGGGVASNVDEVAVAGGGGGGGCAIEWLTGLTPAADITVTVGGGGAGGANTGENGATGVTSSFGAYCSASGGAGGKFTGSTVAAGETALGGSAGTGANGDLNIAGQPGDYGIVRSNVDCNGGNGGGTVLGGGAAGARSPGAGVNGGAYGGGGSGGASENANDRAGGNGAAGVVIVEY